MAKRSDEIRANRPTGAGSTGLAPIGVPSTMRDPETGEERPYEVLRAPRPSDGGQSEGYGVLAPGTQIAVTPRYYEGDEWQPANLSPLDRAELQRMMERAGLYAEGTRFRLGVWDPASRAAYKELLSFANAGGLTVAQALDEYDRVTTMFPKPRELPTYRVSAPEDLRVAFSEGMRAKTGRRPDEQQVEEMVRMYQDRERNVQAAMAYAESGIGLGGPGAQSVTIPGVPDPSTFASDYAERTDPEGVAAQSGMEQMNEFFSLLRGPV